MFNTTLIILTILLRNCLLILLMILLLYKSINYLNPNIRMKIFDNIINLLSIFFLYIYIIRNHIQDMDNIYYPKNLLYYKQLIYPYINIFLGIFLFFYFFNYLSLIIFFNSFNLNNILIWAICFIILMQYSCILWYLDKKFIWNNIYKFQETSILFYPEEGLPSPRIRKLLFYPIRRVSPIIHACFYCIGMIVYTNWVYSEFHPNRTTPLAQIGNKLEENNWYKNQLDYYTPIKKDKIDNNFKE